MSSFVVMFSGGVGSFYTALRVKALFGVRGLYLLFTDTLTEDTSLYRFLVQTAAIVYDIPLEIVQELIDEANAIPAIENALKGDDTTGYWIDEEAEEERRQKIKALADKANAWIPGLVWLYQGRDIYQIFHKERRIVNTFVDPCSKILKRQHARNYIKANFDPDNTIVFLGYDWMEEHRLEKAIPYWLDFGYVVDAPLTRPPYTDKIKMIAGLTEYAIEAPELYVLGFAHNNCAGGCGKGGHGHWALLYDKKPRRFLYFMLKEQGVARYLGKLVTMLTRQEYGQKILYPLSHLRADLQAGKPIDRYDIGGCGCFQPPEGED